MFEQAFRNIDDVLRKEAGCTTELDYTEQTSWLLFLKYLDGLEQDKASEAALDGKKSSYILDKPLSLGKLGPRRKAKTASSTTALTTETQRLASLYEQSQFGPEARSIKGLPNWRLSGLQKAIKEGTLRSLREMIGDDDLDRLA